MIEAIALHPWSSSFLGRADSVVQLHNTSIKNNFSNAYVLKSKAEDIQIFAAYLSLGRLLCRLFAAYLPCRCDYAAGNLSIYPLRRYRLIGAFNQLLCCPDLG
jgi:hypothetical protein